MVNFAGRTGLREVKGSGANWQYVATECPRRSADGGKARGCRPKHKLALAMAKGCHREAGGVGAVEDVGAGGCRKIGAGLAHQRTPPAAAGKPRSALGGQQNNRQAGAQGLTCVINTVHNNGWRDLRRRRSPVHA